MMFFERARRFWDFVRSNRLLVLAAAGWCLTITTSVIKDSKLEGLQSSKDELESARTTFEMAANQFMVVAVMEEDNGRLFNAVFDSNSTTVNDPVTFTLRQGDQLTQRQAEVGQVNLIVANLAVNLELFLRLTRPSSPDVAAITAIKLKAEKFRPAGGRVADLSPSQYLPTFHLLEQQTDDVMSDQKKVMDMASQEIGEAQIEINAAGRRITRWSRALKILIYLSWLLTGLGLFLRHGHEGETGTPSES